MQTGTIKWFDASKGFGFVIPNDGGSDIYVHLRALEKAKLSTVEPGTSVSFSIGSRGGKSFVEELALISEPISAAISDRPEMARGTTTSPSLNHEEEFEREWGLRRA